MRVLLLSALFLAAPGARLHAQEDSLPQAPAPDSGDTKNAPGDEKQDQPGAKNNDDNNGKEDTPSPDERGEIPRPRGYAPDAPQPFLKGPPLWLVQLSAGLGARTLFGSLSWVPFIGLIAMLAAPLAEGMAITFAGDRVGPHRASLFWPVVTSYIVTAVGTTATVALWLMGIAIALPGLGLLLAGGANPTLPYVGAGLLLAGALILVGGTVAWALTSMVSAVASLMAYQLSKQPKNADDNGTDFPRLLPRGKGLPLPFLRGDGEDGDENEEEQPPPGSTPVRFEVRP